MAEQEPNSLKRLMPVMLVNMIYDPCEKRKGAEDPTHLVNFALLADAGTYSYELQRGETRETILSVFENRPIDVSAIDELSISEPVKTRLIFLIQDYLQVTEERRLLENTGLSWVSLLHSPSISTYPYQTFFDKLRQLNHPLSVILSEKTTHISMLSLYELAVLFSYLAPTPANLYEKRFIFTLEELSQFRNWCREQSLGFFTLLAAKTKGKVLFAP